MDFEKLIDAVAKKLGVAVDKIYPALYSKMMLDRNMDIFWIIISLIIIGVGIFIIIKLIKKNKDNSWWEDLDVGICALSVFVSIVFLIVLISCASELIEIYKSPNYYMLRLLSIIK